jgi:plastocyanin
MLALVVAAFVGGGFLLMVFNLLPEDHADEFHPLSAGNMTFQSEIIILKEPTAADDTYIYAINDAAADAISIVQQDEQVMEIMRQVEGRSITIAGVQPTVLLDSAGKEIHSSSGQVIITANQERIDGKILRGPIAFSTMVGKPAEGEQQIWSINVDLDGRKVDLISKEPDRLVQSTVSRDLVVAGMNLYLPNMAEVEPGSSVRWLNESNLPHNVVGTYARNSTGEIVHIDSGFFGKDRNFQYKFDDAGVFEYRCTIHSEEGMNGLLVISGS